MNYNELPTLNSTDKTKHMMTTALLDKERRWNETCVQQKQKLYANKYNLQPQNIYHNLFNFINEKIRYEIEVNEKRMRYGTDDKDEFFVLKRYGQMYDKSSKEVIRLLKTQQVNSLKNTIPTNVTCLSVVKGLDIKKIARKKSVINSKMAKSRVLRQDSDTMTDIKYAKIAKELRTQSTNLRKRLTRDGNAVLQPLTLLNDQLPKHISKTYSKNAYLASLNYDFSNPLL